MKHFYTNGIDEICLDESCEIPEGFYKGFSDKRKLSISCATIGRTAHNKGKKETVKHVYYTNDIISIRIPESETPPDGFHRGRLKRKLTEEEKDQFNTKRRSTLIEKYGIENYNNMEKNKKTKLKNFGDENYNNRDKAKDTCIEKYGVDNPFKSDAIKEKIRQTNIDRYGYSNSFSNPIILQKAIENSTSEDAAQKRMNTCLDRYGVPFAGCAFGLPSGRDSSCNLQFKLKLIENGFGVDDSINREKVIGKYRYDFFVNDTLIEINPSITHNCTKSLYGQDSIRSKNYHLDKTLNAINNGYRCIHVWDWDNTDKIVELIRNRDRRIYARQCSISEISDNTIVRNFLKNNHLQGYSHSSVNIVLTYDNEIISMMTFGKPRYNRNYQYELIRYCSVANVIGGAEKLFKYFINNYSPSSIISYCDMSKFTGKTYEKLNFQKKSFSTSRHWYNMKTKLHITDNLLRLRGFDLLFGTNYGKGTSNEDLMREYGFVEIYDAGQATYTWNR